LIERGCPPGSRRNLKAKAADPKTGSELPLLVVDRGWLPVVGQFKLAHHPLATLLFLCLVLISYPMKRFHLLILLLGIVVPSLRPGFAQSNQDVKSAILARRAAWNKAIVERDTDALADLTTPDFFLIGPAARLDGPAQHKDLFVDLLKRRPDLVYERKPIRVEPMEGRDYAHETGTWLERWTEPDGPTELQGDYFVLWRQIGGEWKEQADVFAPSRCLGKSYCAPRTPASPAPLKRELVQAYAGWYPLSNRAVLEIRSEGTYLVAHCPALFGDAPLTPKSDTEFDVGGWTVRFPRRSQAASAESVELVQGEKLLLRGKRLAFNP